MAAAARAASCARGSFGMAATVDRGAADVGAVSGVPPPQADTDQQAAMTHRERTARRTRPF
ncbi:hypothetical protein GCM10009661_57800 [Catellatospora chokoriensis]|uniref:Uncharacterized protein n=1 Tax=Catellatospora chokoriensis TaxID=310353 RepID=A0A8J3KBQ6_9ACTN|nr:hypothetical protein Cch02nite_72570 [Catellatospora chokoriensis]